MKKYKEDENHNNSNETIENCKNTIKNLDDSESYSESKIKTEVYPALCPFSCGMKLQSTLLSHISKSCPNMDLIYSGEIRICKYNSLHIVKTKHLCKHYKRCKYNYDILSDDALEESDDLLYIALKNYLKQLTDDMKNKTYIKPTYKMKKKNERSMDFNTTNISKSNSVLALYNTEGNSKIEKDRSEYNSMVFGENYELYNLNEYC